MIRTEDLTYSIGEFTLQSASISLDKGEYFVLLGPPGSGKSIFLECLCGLNRPQSGRIYIGEKDVTGLEPRRRGIGYVPQDYALFPHFSVEKNIGFGLAGRKLSLHDKQSKIRAKASLLGIEHLLKRRIPGLSGGEKQRVALARALCIEPDVLLMDEPVSALDESTRESVCAQLRELQQELDITTIHVSHNLEEAFSVADRGAIIHRGIFQQIGTLDKLLRRPASAFVARFMRCGNLLTGQANVSDAGSTTTEVTVNGMGFRLPGRHSGQASFIIRPENIHISATPNTAVPIEGTIVSCTLVRAVDRGAYVRLSLGGAVPLTAHLPHHSFVDMDVSEGSELSASINTEAIHVLPCE